MIIPFELTGVEAFTTHTTPASFNRTLMFVVCDDLLIVYIIWKGLLLLLTHDKESNLIEGD